MSNLTEQRNHPPFTVDALVGTANEFLTPRGAAPVTKRTLRFYTTQRVVPAPIGSPKFARYNYDHLLTLLAARAMQDQGFKLEQIREEVSEVVEGKTERIENIVDSWLDQGPPLRPRSAVIREARANYNASVQETLAKIGTASQSSIRINLTKLCSLELAEDDSPRAALVDAHRALSRLIEKLGPPV